MPIERINDADHDDLMQTLLACLDVPAWAAAMAAGRPYSDPEQLYAAADSAARRLTSRDLDWALATHPRIGDLAEGPGTRAGWSRQEQSGVSRDDRTQQELERANGAYEDQFGRVFLICATGLTGDEILSALRERLDNDDETEAAVVADELRKIALLRLRNVVES